MTEAHQYIETDIELRSFCEGMGSAQFIGFDTEFVSEDTYRPDLCLIQVAADDELAIIDPRPLSDLSPFWQALCEGEHVTLVHAGREEFRFCWQALGQRPQRLFDTQLAAGLIGLEYPSSYGKLISRLLNETLPKGETRTDWRRRPLTSRQLEYALKDVTYLRPLYDSIHAELSRLKRVDWLADEMQRWQDQLEEFEQRENWRRVSGSTGLSDRSLAIMRELWRWREREAETQNRPPRRVLRDDLLVELSRRGKSDPSQIRAVRGIDRYVGKRQAAAVAECIDRARNLPRSEWPKPVRRKPSNHATLVGQFIATALNTMCRDQQLAPSLVGTVQDVRDLVEYRLSDGQDTDEVPALSVGWRATVVGKTIDQLLNGELSIRIGDPRSESPLHIEPSRGTE